MALPNWLHKTWDEQRPNLVWYGLGLMATVLIAVGAWLTKGLAAWQFFGVILILAIFLAWSVAATVAFIYHRPTGKTIEPVTPENIEPRIGEWLDSFSLGRRKLVNETAHLELEVKSQTGVPIALLRTKEHPHYVTLVCKIDLGEQHKPLFDKLSQIEKTKLLRRLRSEAAKAKIAYTFDLSGGNIAIEKRMPITNTFSEADLIDGFSDVNFSAIIVGETVASLLEGQPEAKQPVSTPSTAASPHSPTS